MTEKNNENSAMQLSNKTKLQSRNFSVITNDRMFEQLSTSSHLVEVLKQGPSLGNIEIVEVESAGHSEPEYLEFTNGEIT
jgi:hypothetical protein